MNFTPEQQSAIDAKNRELLVSAAAGSGKTAVLVRRILHLIRDEDYSIDRMLVVTYTRAAAAELRDRLETAMRDAALSDPAMARQAELVGQSQISTIHSYCQKVIREHFRFCQIDPQFCKACTGMRRRKHWKPCTPAPKPRRSWQRCFASCRKSSWCR